LADAVPDDEAIFEDLRAVLGAYEKVIAPQEPPVDLQSVLVAFLETLANAGLAFGTSHDRLVRAFLASLVTKPLVILTGLSGSGKTQIAVKFGEWLGLDRCCVVPVRPDWTGPEALFGYKDLLQPVATDGRKAWVVPEVLDFILAAARDASSPYALVLDEMNLAHVERYFADFLSGMETGKGVLPNLVVENGVWRESKEDAALLPIPRNLFVIGTVNVDETTYMFSPKVLDRANTLEFRVDTSDLNENATKPATAKPGEPQVLRDLLRVATDDQWQIDHPAEGLANFTRHLKALHGALSRFDAEFGHRSFYEALRFASIYASLGDPTWEAALDLQVMQKILPKMHGSRRKLEPVLATIGHFAFDLTASQEASPSGPQFDPLGVDQSAAKLPQSFSKTRRMLVTLRANQFASFAE
jgi:5-methylcytosine-specific restriction protein B